MLGKHQLHADETEQKATKSYIPSIACNRKKSQYIPYHIIHLEMTPQQPVPEHDIDKTMHITPNIFNYPLVLNDKQAFPTAQTREKYQIDI